MKKFLLIYAMGATLLLIICALMLHHSNKETKRLRNNTEALMSEVKFYKTKMDESAASVLALDLKLKEYKELYARDVERIKSLQVRPRRVESVAKVATQCEIEAAAPLSSTDTIREVGVSDSLPTFHWNDKWVTIEGAIRNDSLLCKINSVDTIHQVVHRVPRRFLFIRYGTKAIRQEIVSSNPHTHIVYTEYIELPSKRKRRR